MAMGWGVLSLCVAAAVAVEAQPKAQTERLVGVIELSVHPERPMVFVSVDEGADGVLDRGFLVELAAGAKRPPALKERGAIEWRRSARLVLQLDVGTGSVRHIAFESKRQSVPSSPALSPQDMAIDIVGLQRFGFLDRRSHAQLAPRILERRIGNGRIPLV